VRDARYCCYVISESFWLTPRPGFSVQMTLMPAAWAADFLLMFCYVSSSCFLAFRRVLPGYLKTFASFPPGFDGLFGGSPE
jgi:hypothetical protein